MIEARARNILRHCYSAAGLEAWMADQPWLLAADGWIVEPELGGRRFHLWESSGGLMVLATATDGRAPAVWQVLARAESL